MQDKFYTIVLEYFFDVNNYTVIYLQNNLGKDFIIEAGPHPPEEAAVHCQQDGQHYQGVRADGFEEQV